MFFWIPLSYLSRTVVLLFHILNEVFAPDESLYNLLFLNLFQVFLYFCVKNLQVILRTSKALMIYSKFPEGFMNKTRILLYNVYLHFFSATY